jgi:hypothetical protein
LKKQNPKQDFSSLSIALLLLLLLLPNFKGFLP